MIDYFRYYFSWVFYIVIICYSFNNLTTDRPRLYKYRFLALYVMLYVFSVFNNINGDHYNYIKYLRDMDFYLYLENIELVYHLIAQFLNYNVLQFRIVLTITTYMLLYIIITRYSRDKKVALLFFICIYWMLFSSALRSCISDAFFFSGLLPFVNRRNWLTFILLSIFVTSAIFFHKSTFLLIPSAIISFLPFNKKSFKYLIMLLPLWIFVGLGVFNYVLGTGYFDKNLYLSGEEIENKSFSVVLVRIISDVSIVLLTILNFFVNGNNLPKKFSLYLYLYRFIGYSLIIYFVLLFLPTSNYVHERFLMHLAIPNLLLLSYLPYCKKTLQVNIMIKSCMLLWLIAINIGILRRLLDQEAIVKRMF